MANYSKRQINTKRLEEVCGEGGVRCSNYLNNKINLLNYTCKYNIIYITSSIILLLIICSPLILKTLKLDISLCLVEENRYLSQAPKFKDNPLKDLPKLWDQYFKDRMPFRQIFMPGYLFTYENLLKSYVSECVTGRNGEIFI